MKLQLAVLFGGKSVEHEISVISALQAAAALDREKYDVIPLYLTKDNEFYTGEDVGRIEAYRDIPALLARSQQVVPARLGGKAVLLRQPAKAFGKQTLAELDCVFPIVHGTNAEDGTIQGLLRLLGVPFVGCDILASAVGMDKYVMKTVFKDNGIPVLDCLCVRTAEYDADPDAALAALQKRFRFPVIVKPVNLGSSVGITKAGDEDALRRALELAFQFAPKVLVEPAVQSLQEINCAVLGDADSARASVCEEPLNAEEILSYENKYMSGGGKGGKTGAKSAPAGGSKGAGMASLDRRIPADIPPALETRIRELAVRAFQCIDAAGVARIDFLLDKESGDVWLNEINTIPGSLSFYLWEPAGLAYRDLLREMVDLAFRRARQQEDLTFSFETNVLAGAKIGGSKGIGN
ncbi:MAG: D-alanine--D-alanine ligase [Oscillospiraceae bacterium]|jgi:D-alanine-D-alanine ligase|nr:D-alanine--D-alanine ligase [Oscillospiraceae bacterium]